ncbi:MULTISPECIES: Lrp/AsnC family transcriptional regulator [unclassified Ruegeria]|uniref:Lrp/AsnC ligand binding domain-containing protein n=1 Tax=Ruegeria sp. HKCCE4148 TaxID=2794829 RepID=UPI001488873C|nr:AsnC family transcriptional regulator [Ruegeria sp. HKCCD7296]NOD49721.1 AsnC family transcriptional regulator [Ruegeria sp. HKCCD5849]NOD53925.1 AsnC family transcriptional regulator [Ruegeria sp. HKCCD5851]NOD68870.1 AsnC family transcriptional regulator [Ruegeria sp. HKCCD7303]NOE34578.1 AsnC family transcriptional regulator [Ruegeria sp. HKCCD7318]NOE43714.1 AsnC family transcriptional regulator [Ruegeria sp. HKCCD7319]
MFVKLDQFDRSLLHLMQRDAKMGLEALASETGLSVASVQRRLKALRASGAIHSEVAIVDPKKLGVAMSFVVMVELERERQDQIDAFSRQAQAEPRVQQCYYITGDADFCLICAARDMDDFEELTKKLFFDNSNVRRFRTSVVMGRKKVGLGIPVKDNGMD